MLWLCLDYFKNPDHRRQYESDVGPEISKFTCKSLENLFSNVSALEMDKLSLNLSHQVRYSGQLWNPLLRPFETCVPTSDPRTTRTSALVQAICESRALAGVAFEAAGQSMLHGSGTFDGAPLPETAHSPTSMVLQSPPAA